MRACQEVVALQHGLQKCESREVGSSHLTFQVKGSFSQAKVSKTMSAAKNDGPYFTWHVVGLVQVIIWQAGEPLPKAS